MSGMFETKTDKASRKLALSKKEEKAKKKSRIITITVISVLILFSAVAILINSGFIRRTLPVVTIDGVNFNAAEMEYFFNSEYMEYANMMSQFGGFGMAMPDANRPLAAQLYDPDTGETWADYFLGASFARMSNLVSLYNAAAAAGFTLSDDRLSDIEEDIAMIELQAVLNNFPSANSLLQQMYGSSININTYRNIMKFVTLAWAYNEHMRESFTYSSEQLDNFYNENRDDLDVFNFRIITIAAEYVDREEFDSDEAYEEALDTAIKTAHDKAQNLVFGGIDDAEAFVAAAQVEAGSTADSIGAVQSMMGQDFDDEYGEWFLDASRSYGDIIIFSDDSGSTVIFFESRDNNNYHTVGMRQLLILRDNVNPGDFAEGENDPEYISALEEAERALHERAEQINTSFINAGRTEAALIDLISEHSDDTTPGGEYSNIAKSSYQSQHLSIMKVVPELEEWLFAEGRNVGDSELVYTAAYGYHLVYFTGFGDLFFELMADDRKRTADHTDWAQTLILVEPVKRAAFILVHM